MPPLVVVVDWSSVIKEFPNKEPGEKGENLTQVLNEYGAQQMVITERAKRALREIGLTGYEINAYTALLVKGPCEASQTSKEAGVPYSKIYDVLSSLENKGWVEVENSRPKKYFPKHPSEALEATRLNIESNLQSNLDLAKTDLEPLYASKEIQERPDIWIARGAFNMLARMREALNSARQTLMVATAPPPRPIIDVILKDLEHLSSMGVEIKLMVTKDMDEEIIQKLSELGEVRVKERMFGGGVVSDDRRVVLLLGSGDTDDYLALCSDHAGLASLAREYFQFLWDEAKSK